MRSISTKRTKQEDHKRTISTDNTHTNTHTHTNTNSHLDCNINTEENVKQEQVIVNNTVKTGKPIIQLLSQNDVPQQQMLLTPGKGAIKTQDPQNDGRNELDFMDPELMQLQMQIQKQVPNMQIQGRGVGAASAGGCSAAYQRNTGMGMGSNINMNMNMNMNMKGINSQTSSNALPSFRMRNSEHQYNSLCHIAPTQTPCFNTQCTPTHRHPITTQPSSQQSLTFPSLHENSNRFNNTTSTNGTAAFNSSLQGNYLTSLLSSVFSHQQNEQNSSALDPNSNMNLNQMQQIHQIMQLLNQNNGANNISTPRSQNIAATASVLGMLAKQLQQQSVANTSSQAPDSSSVRGEIDKRNSESLSVGTNSLCSKFENSREGESMRGLNSGKASNIPASLNQDLNTQFQKLHNHNREFSEIQEESCENSKISESMHKGHERFNSAACVGEREKRNTEDMLNSLKQISSVSSMPLHSKKESISLSSKFGQISQSPNFMTRVNSKMSSIYSMPKKKLSFMESIVKLQRAIRKFLKFRKTVLVSTLNTNLNTNLNSNRNSKAHQSLPKEPQQTEPPQKLKTPSNQAQKADNNESVLEKEKGGEGLLSSESLILCMNTNLPHLNAHERKKSIWSQHSGISAIQEEKSPKSPKHSQYPLLKLTKEEIAHIFKIPYDSNINHQYVQKQGEEEQKEGIQLAYHYELPNSGAAGVMGNNELNFDTYGIVRTPEKMENNESMVKSPEGGKSATRSGTRSRNSYRAQEIQIDSQTISRALKEEIKTVSDPTVQSNIDSPACSVERVSPLNSLVFRLTPLRSSLCKTLGTFDKTESSLNFLNYTISTLNATHQSDLRNRNHIESISLDPLSTAKNPLRRSKANNSSSFKKINLTKEKENCLEEEEKGFDNKNHEEEKKQEECFDNNFNTVGFVYKNEIENLSGNTISSSGSMNTKLNNDEDKENHKRRCELAELSNSLKLEQTKQRQENLTAKAKEENTGSSQLTALGDNYTGVTKRNEREGENTSPSLEKLLTESTITNTNTVVLAPIEPTSLNQIQNQTQTQNHNEHHNEHHNEYENEYENEEQNDIKYEINYQNQIPNENRNNIDIGCNLNMQNSNSSNGSTNLKGIDCNIIENPSSSKFKAPLSIVKVNYVCGNKENDTKRLGNELVHKNWIEIPFYNHNELYNIIQSLCY